MRSDPSERRSVGTAFVLSVLLAGSLLLVAPLGGTGRPPSEHAGPRSPAFGAEGAAIQRAKAEGRTAAGTQVVSATNWGGYTYCASNCSGSNASTMITSVSATWAIAPIASTSSATEYASSWVGIGGYNTTDLIQDGSEEQISPGGTATVSVWWEMLPQPEVEVALSPDPTVSVGDTVLASVSFAGLVGTEQAWTFVLRDLTTGSGWASTEYCSSACTPSQFGTADWIQESPTYGEVVQLPAYATFAFSNDSVVAGGVNATLASLPASQIVLIEQTNPAYFPGNGVQPSAIYSNGEDAYFFVQYLVGAVDLSTPCCSIAPSVAELGSSVNATYELFAPAPIAPGPATTLALALSISGVRTGSRCATPESAGVGLSLPEGFTNATVRLDLCPNLGVGPYDYQVGLWYVPDGGYVRGPDSLELTASPWLSGLTLNGTVYPVTFEETNFTLGQSWGVDLAGSLLNSTSTSLTFAAPNGTFNYSVRGPAGWGADPPNATVTVNGGRAEVSLLFVAVYAMAFTAANLASGTNWSVTVSSTSSAVILALPPAGAPATGNGFTLTRWSDGSWLVVVYAANGTYQLSFFAPGCWPVNAVASVNGSATSPLTVTFRRIAPPPNGGVPTALELLVIAVVGIALVVTVALAGRRRTAERPRAPAPAAAQAVPAGADVGIWIVPAVAPPAPAVGSAPTSPPPPAVYVVSPAAGRPAGPTGSSCPYCGLPLAFVPQYGRFYCYRCLRYP